MIHLRSPDINLISIELTCRITNSSLRQMVGPYRYRLFRNGKIGFGQPAENLMLIEEQSNQSYFLRVSFHYIQWVHVCFCAVLTYHQPIHSRLGFVVFESLEERKKDKNNEKHSTKNCSVKNNDMAPHCFFLIV